MPPHETYTDLMRQFWQCQKEKEHSFQPSELAVYVHLVDTCFALECNNPFKHANGYLRGVLGISEKAFISARNRLQQAGRVGFTARQAPARFEQLRAVVPLEGCKYSTLTGRNPSSCRAQVLQTTE